MKELDFVEKQREVWYHEWRTVENRRKELEEAGLPLVEELGRAPLKTDFGDFTFVEYGDKTTGYEHKVLVYGDIRDGALGDGEDVLIRMHSACWTSEVAHAVNCECRQEKNKALKAIAKEGRGIFLYLQQEGRGTGVGKMLQLDRMLEFEDGEIKQRVDENGERVDTDKAYKEAGYPSECRDYSCAGEILNQLGVKSVRMMTNNPDKIESIREAGIGVERIGIHVAVENEIVEADLRSKHENLGHFINEEQWALK